MPGVIVNRPDASSEEVAYTLREGLGRGYKVLSGTGMNGNPAGASRPDKSDMVVAGKGSTRLYRAEVTISWSGDRTDLHVIAGASACCCDYSTGSGSPNVHVGACRPRSGFAAV